MKPTNDSVVELFYKSCYRPGPNTLKVELAFEK